MEKKELQNETSGFVDTFLGKLKEQSFTILIMVAVIYYQHRLMEERVAYWQKLYEEKEAYVEQTTKEDRETSQERIKYLQEQRDKYVEDAINELKTK